jgi:uncharacterized protein YodC (DUF2158 family)
MEEEFKVGDVVQLRSGGRKMTVTALPEGKGPGDKLVQCDWFEGPFGDQRKQRSDFPAEALEKKAVSS